MCLYAIAKYLLFVFNFLFWCAGAAVLGIGIWLEVDSNALSDTGVDVYGAGPIVFIAAGAVMLVFGFFGCCGAIKESPCLLGTYFTMLLIIFGLEVGIGVWAFVNYDSVEEVTMESTYNLFSTDYSEDAADTVQQRFKCCGSTELTSSANTEACAVYKGPGGLSGGLDSCECDTLEAGVCVKTSDLSSTITTQCGTPTVDQIFVQDCGEEVTQFTQDNIRIIGIVGLSIGLAELIGMFISMCLCCKIKKEGDV